MLFGVRELYIDRKEILPEHEIVIGRPFTHTVVDSSNSNSLNAAANNIFEIIHVTDNEITFKSLVIKFNNVKRII